MRFKLTSVSSINYSSLVRFVYIGVFVLFPGVCLLWSALPFFDIFIFVCVCVCVCVYMCVLEWFH